MSWTADLLRVVTGLLVMPAAILAQPATQPAADDFVISPTRLQQMKAAAFFYTELEASFADFNDVARPAHQRLRDAMVASGNRPAGPEMIVYSNLPADRNTRFQFQLGILVETGAKPHGEFKVRELPGIKCVTIIYSGPIEHIRDAYRQLMTDIAAAGQQLAGEIRESALLWEGEQSANNVVMLQAAVK